jgi:hypothetical protein
MVTSGPTMYLIMEDQFLSGGVRRNRLPQSSRMPSRSPVRLAGIAGLRLSAWGRTQIVLLGMRSGSHMKDQVADHIGGSVRPCFKQGLITQRARAVFLPGCRPPTVNALQGCRLPG